MMRKMPLDKILEKWRAPQKAPKALHNTILQQTRPAPIGHQDGVYFQGNLRFASLMVIFLLVGFLTGYNGVGLSPIEWTNESETVLYLLGDYTDETEWLMIL